MPNIEEKLKHIEKLQDEVYDHIWSVFRRYLAENNILFNQPEGYEYEGANIYFFGKDGCRGCYDDKSVHIPIRFFIDPNKEFEKDRIRKVETESKRKADELAETSRKEVQRLLELQRKYPHVKVEGHNA